MANILTTSDYNEIKNTSLQLFFFDAETKLRKFTCGNMNYKSAIEEISRRSNELVIITDRVHADRIHRVENGFGMSYKSRISYQVALDIANVTKTT